MIFKIIYYQFFLFYSKRLGQNDPHYYALIAMSGGEAFILMNLIDLSYIIFTCGHYHFGINIAIWVVTVWINFTYFSRAKSMQIMKEPKNFSSHPKLGILIALTFFLFTIVCMIFGPILGKDLLQDCF